MNIKNFFRGTLRKFIFGGSSVASLFGRLYSTGALRRVSAETDPYGNFAGWVYFAINKIAERVGAMEFEMHKLQKSGKVKEIFDHEVLSILYRVNPVMTKYDFFYLVATYLKLWGSAPIYVVRERGLTNLFPMRPDLAKMKQGADGNVAAWEYRVGGKIMQFKADEVIHIRIPDPKNPLNGRSAFAACALEIDVDAAAAIFNKYYLENNAEPNGVIETDGTLSDETFNRLKAEWSSRYGGPGNAGKPAILEAGLKWKSTSASMKEVGYRETRQFSKEMILNIFGVPEALFAKDSTYANAEVAERVFARETVDPMMRIIVEQLNEFFVPRFGDDLDLGYVSPVREDDKQKLDIVTQGVGKWMTPNEARAEYGMDPIDGGDALTVPIATPGMQETTSGKGAGRECMNRKEREIKKRILARSFFKRKVQEGILEKVQQKILEAKGRKEKVVGIRLKSEHAEILKTERKAFLKRTEAREKVFARKMKECFEAQKKATLERLRTAGLPKGKKADERWATQVAEQDDEAVKKTLVEQYLTDIKNGAVAIGALMGKETVDLLGVPAVKKYIESMPVEIAGAINKTTKDALIVALNEGVDAGLGIEDVSKRVAAVFDDRLDFRSERIARTEVGRGENFARYQEMKALGAKERVWMAVFRNTRDSHARADGQVVAIDRDFEVGGYTATHPHDPNLPASESVNCQCSVSPYLAD